MIIDSHCHLNYEPMSEDLSDVIKRANNAGINYMLTISTEDKSLKIFYKLLISLNVFLELMESIRMKLNRIRI